ncbi:MAG: alpha/beta hydrolase [Thermodesulfobacteriota bacterium]
MSSVVVGRDSSGSIDLYYEDHGSGRPVVLIHGWPLSGSSWEKQVAALLAAGYRVLRYDRRGFGQSSKPATGYDFDTLADDLYQLLSRLDLYDVTLVGFAMGTGELARYLGAYGAKRVRDAVFLASLPPFLLKTPDNPGGIDAGVFEAIKRRLAVDRSRYLSTFFSDFYNVDVLGGDRVDENVVRRSWRVAMAASPRGTRDCVTAWTTDFRPDCRRVDVPALVVHGGADRILPLAATGAPLQKRLRASRLVVIDGAPHGLTWTHAEQVNRELLAFLAERP